MSLPTHNGETEAAINYRIGTQVGADLADTHPKLVTLGYAIRRHMVELNKGIRLGPFELDYKSGFATGWLRKRGF